MPELLTLPDAYRSLFGLEQHDGYRPGARLTLQNMQVVADAGDEAVGGGRWTAVVVVEGVRTTDHREVRPGALTTRDLPLPLMGLDTTTWGHEDAVYVGAMETCDRVNNDWIAGGSFAPTEAGGTFQGYVERQEVRWVSADLEVTASEYIEISVGGDPYGDVYYDDEYGIGGIDDWWEQITEGRIMGATICPFPAFPQCVIVPEGMAFPETTADNGLPTISLPGLAASANVDLRVPPAEWMNDPQLTGPTHLTVQSDGRVFGHLCTWDQPHIGMPFQTFAPRSTSGYSYFRTGTRLCSDAEGNEVAVRTGPLTIGGGHADRTLGWRAAAEHYDNACSAWADVACGEDEFGLWVAGAVRPGISDDVIVAARASDVSGDWRDVGGELDLIAALSVNVAGFPVRNSLAAAAMQMVGPVALFDGRPRAGVVDGRQTSLVAAGVVTRNPMEHALVKMAREIAAMRVVVSAVRPLAVEQLQRRIVGG